MKNESKPIEIGLWANTDKNGNLWLSGNWGPARISIFKNTYKEPGTKQPDFRMYLEAAPKKEKEEKKDDLPF